MARIYDVDYLTPFYNCLDYDFKYIIKIFLPGLRSKNLNRITKIKITKEEKKSCIGPIFNIKLWPPVKPTKINNTFVKWGSKMERDEP